jgi:hypothetical protein
MHNSDNPDLETAAVRLYLDESGGDDPGTPHVVIGGMLINRRRFEQFENAWDAMLENHGIVPPLHMKEFGRPDGRFANMSDCCRRELFLEVADVVNSHKIGSLSASLGNEEYRQYFSQEARTKFNVYGMCFLLAVMMNHQSALQNSYQDKIPFILDSGNPYAHHVRSSHATIVQMQREGAYLHMGSLTFAEDDDFGILQAADVIAWGARRRITNIPFGFAFEPISRIVTPSDHHADGSWKSEWLKEVWDSILHRLDNGV